MNNRNKFHYLLKVNEFGLIKNDKIRWRLAQFGYLPRAFTFFGVWRHVLFRATLHKTSLLSISKLFLHWTHAQWCSRVDILQCNVAWEQVQSSGGIFADEQGTRLCLKDEWDCRRWSAARILLSLNSTRAIPVELQLAAMGLTSDPVTTAAVSDPGTKSFPILPEPRAEFETDTDECWFIKLMTELERCTELYSIFITYCFSVLSLSVFSCWDC